MSNVKYEYELYPPMCNWLYNYLCDKHKGRDCKIEVIDAHAVDLDSVLEKHGVIKDYPHIVGLQIQIDVLGIVKYKDNSEISFIEAKKTQLNLHDLGQLWAYCKLCNPSDAFLLSSVGLGNIEKILKNLRREDMLDYGDGTIIKKMKVAKWDVSRNSIDFHTMIPQI